MPVSGASWPTQRIFRSNIRTPPKHDSWPAQPYKGAAPLTRQPCSCTRRAEVVTPYEGRGGQWPPRQPYIVIACTIFVSPEHPNGNPAVKTTLSPSCTKPASRAIPLALCTSASRLSRLSCSMGVQPQLRDS